MHSARSSRLSADGHEMYVPTSLFKASLNTVEQLWTAPVPIPNLFATSTGPRKKDKHGDKEEKHLDDEQRVPNGRKTLDSAHWKKNRVSLHPTVKHEQYI